MPLPAPLDLMLPVVNLGQKYTFNPGGIEQWLSYFERSAETLSGIHHLLAQSLDRLPWVIVGLLFWVAVYVQLYRMKPDTIGEVVT